MAWRVSKGVPKFYGVLVTSTTAFYGVYRLPSNVIVFLMKTCVCVLAAAPAPALDVDEWLARAKQAVQGGDVAWLQV